MSNENLQDTPLPILGRLLAISDDVESAWSPEELNNILVHELDAPFQQAWGYIEEGKRNELALIGGVAVPPILNLRNLLLHPHPPERLLQLTKDFAQEARSLENAALPEAILTIIYFAVIGSSLNTLGQPLTTLDKQSIINGLKWCRKQPWLDTALAAIFNQALAKLNG